MELNVVNLADILEADVQDVLFADMGQQATYRRKSDVYAVSAVVLEGTRDVEEELSVVGRAEVYVSVKELVDKGIGEPLPHDVIGVWEVEEREKIGGLWRLVCFSVVRPKP